MNVSNIGNSQVPSEVNGFDLWVSNQHLLFNIYLINYILAFGIFLPVFVSQ